MPSPIRFCISILLAAVLAICTLGDVAASLYHRSGVSMDGCRSGSCCCKSDNGSVARCCEKERGAEICYSAAGCSAEFPSALQAPEKEAAVIQEILVAGSRMSQLGKTLPVDFSYGFEFIFDLFHPPQA